MKFVFLVLVIVSVFFVGYSQALACLDPQFCVKSGGNCTDDSAMCEKGTYCAYTFNNNGLIGTCIPQVALNAACNDDYNCLNSDYDNVVCFNKTCQQATWDGNVGDVCNNLNNCKNEYFCNNTNWLDSGVCVKGVELGQNCSYVPCGVGLVCNAGSCIKAFSVAQGQYCDFGGLASYSPICSAGLYCQANKTMGAPAGAGVCAKGFASSKIPCAATATCNNTNEICLCDAIAGTIECTAPATVTSAQASAILDLQQCAIRYNCNTFDIENCCNKYQCDATFATVPKDYYEQRVKAAKSCGFSDPLQSCESIWGRYSTGERIGIIVAGIAIVAIVAGLIVFFVKKRRHHYTRINH